MLSMSVFTRNRIHELCIANEMKPLITDMTRSPLAHRVVDLIALAAADGYGVEELEGAQADAGDGNQVRAKHKEDGFGVVESDAQVVIHRDHQWIGSTAQTPVT